MHDVLSGIFLCLNFTMLFPNKRMKNRQEVHNISNYQNKEKRMNVFNIMGPIMIGPSSSHTAGAVRIGSIAGMLIKGTIKTADVGFFGSFAKTYKGHGTDKAIVGGILGMRPDDDKICDSLKIAKEKNIEITFYPIMEETDYHPNTAIVQLMNEVGEKVKVLGTSIGGGNIQISEINDMPVFFTGQYDTMIVLHKDVPGMIADVTKFLANKHINVCSFKLSRMERGGTAVMTIEVDDHIPDNIKPEIMKIKDIINCVIINKQ